MQAAGYFIVSLLIILPFGVWGATVHFGHAHSLIIAALIALGLLLPNQWMRLFVFYVAGWLAYIAAGLFIGFLTADASLTLILIDGSFWIILGALVFAVIYHSAPEKEAIFNIICIAAAIQASIGLLQSFGIDPVFDFFGSIVAVTTELDRTAAVGTLGNNNFLAAFIAISLPFFFRRGWFYVLPLIIACLIACKTSTAFVAAASGAAFYFYLQARANLKWSIPAATAALGAVAYYVLVYHPILQNDRPDLWIDGIRKATMSWHTLLIGYGPTAEWKIGDKLHSEYVMTLYNFGLIGLGLLAAYIVSVLKRFRQIDRILAAAFVIICIDAIGNHLMHTIPTALLAIVTMALLERGTQ